MDYEAELVWDDDDEATASKAAKLFKVVEKTKKFLTTAFIFRDPEHHQMPVASTRCQWRDKNGASKAQTLQLYNIYILPGRGVGRIFKGGFHDPPAKLRGRGYATCPCAY